MGFPLSKRCHRSLWWLCDLSLVQHCRLGGVIEPHLAPDHGAVKPNNVLLILVGAGIPWISCNGFNSGDPYTANHRRGAALLNNPRCCCLLTWPLLDVLYYRKPQILSSVNGMTAGFMSIRLLLSRPQQAWWLAGGALSLELAWAALPVDYKPHRKKVPFVRNTDDTLGV